jgi:hypothetical protein
LYAANLVLVAFSADVFFWVVGVIGCSCSIGNTVFRLFGDADINSTAGGAIGVVCVEKADRWFVPERTTRVNCFFSNPSWANAEDESSPNASSVSRGFFILAVRLTEWLFEVLSVQRTLMSK